MNRPASARGYEVAAMGLAGALAVLWLWINYCRFPGSPWNDIRLTAVFMAAKGEPVYTMPGAGILNTWLYGPVPLWAWWPATFASNAISALMTAGTFNALLTIAAIAATCRWWPAPNSAPGSRALAFAACIALWPDHAFRFLQADNVAVALGLVSNLLLVRSGPRPHHGWLAAATAAAALGCKQTTLGLLIAQIVWLGWGKGRSAALAHLARTVVVGGVLLGLAALQFGGRELWFGLVSIPRGLPLADDLGARLREMAPHLALQLALPVLVILVAGRRWLVPGNHLSLPLLAFLLSLPLGVFGLLGAGGTINSFQGYQYLLPALALYILSLPTMRPALISAALSVVVVSRILLADDAPVRPALSDVRHAMALQQARPDGVWLPWNTLVSFFADHRFYHAEDGIYVRFITGHSVSLGQAHSGLPQNLHVIAFPSPQMQWHVADKLAPPGAVEKRDGTWLLLEWP